MNVHWLYQIPHWAMALLVVGGTVGWALTGMLAARSYVEKRWAREREAINFFVQSCSMIYAVLLAMIAVAAWDNYNAFNERVDAEASDAGAIFRNAEGLPPAQRLAVRMHIREYVRDTVTRVWPDMRADRPINPNDLVPADHIMPLVGELTHFKPADPGEATIQGTLLEKLDHLLTLRRQRLTGSQVGLMPLLWWVVLLGAVMNLSLTMLVTASDRRLNILLTGGYATFLGMMLFAIMALDHPTWGAVSVGPEAFEEVAVTMDTVMKAL